MRLLVRSDQRNTLIFTYCQDITGHSDIRNAIHSITPYLQLICFQGVASLRRKDNPSQLSHQCLRVLLRCRFLFSGQGILTLSPFETDYCQFTGIKPLPQNRLTHVQLLFTWNPSPLQPSKFSFEYSLLPPRSAVQSVSHRLKPFAFELNHTPP